MQRDRKRERQPRENSIKRTQTETAEMERSTERPIERQEQKK